MVLAHLKTLLRHSAIYGAADVFGTLVNFVLLPILTRHLTSTDYGTLGILLLFGVSTKILFRMGLDSGFFRIYYEQQSDRDRRVFTTTILITVSLISLSLFALSAFLAGPISRLLLGSDQGKLVVLVATDTLLMGLAFVPMNLFRIEERARYFATATLFRNSLNAGLKLVLVLRGWGVEGVLWSDVISSSLFVLALVPTLRRNLTLGYSTAMLREAFGFGLPKVPHGLAGASSIKCCYAAAGSGTGAEETRLRLPVSKKTSIRDHKGIVVAKKMSRKVSRRVVRPACIAGVRISRPNFRVPCGRTKL